MKKTEIKKAVAQIDNLSQNTYLQDVVYVGRFASMQGGQITPFNYKPMNEEDLWNVAGELLGDLILLGLPSHNALFRSLDALAEGIGFVPPMKLIEPVLDMAQSLVEGGKDAVNMHILISNLPGVEEDELKEGFTVDSFGVIDVSANLTERKQEYRRFMNSRD